MNRWAVNFGILLCLLNASICQAEIQDGISCLLGDAHEPCGFDRACELRGCELTHDGVQPTRSMALPLPDRCSLPRRFVPPPTLGVESEGLAAPGDPSRPPSCDLRRVLALLQCFLC